MSSVGYLDSLLENFIRANQHIIVGWFFLFIIFNYKILLNLRVIFHTLADTMIQESELILNTDGSVYHLGLLPQQISDTIITVGDPDRVDSVVQHFNTTEFILQKREFKTVTGQLNGKRITVISTGIGTDNIDIVFNELDALVNVNLQKREVKSDLTQLTFIRLGTSGAIIPEVNVDSVILSHQAVGLEGLMHYYTDHTDDSEILNACGSFFQNFPVKPYSVYGDQNLLDHFSDLGSQGITLTALGFYAPQARGIRLDFALNFRNLAQQLKPKGYTLTNLEMETAGIYGMSKLLGHRAISINAILANRSTGAFSNQPGKTVNEMIEKSLDLITQL